MTQNKQLTTVGRAERIDFLDIDAARVPAKIDTGADISSVWASGVAEKAGQLQFQLFGPGSQYYTGQVIKLAAGDYKLTRVANSFGDKELRYVVKLRIKVQGRVIKVSFTLANRAAKVYPVLLGRRMLAGKFVVDVTKGQPLLKEEKQKLKKLKVELNEQED